MNTTMRTDDLLSDLRTMATEERAAAAEWRGMEPSYAASVAAEHDRRACALEAAAALIADFDLPPDVP